MRTSWRRLPPKGNKLTSWAEAYVCHAPTDTKDSPCTIQCLYEDVSPGEGETLQAAKDDFLENIRLKITELTEMLEFCAKNNPRIEIK